MPNRSRLLLLIAAVSLGSQIGCESYNHQVIAATGTSIGVDISQNPATQVPQAKLGYQRVELAIVPTNRSAEKTTTTGNSMGGGASDHGEVIMELRYGGIFDTGKSSGIYQRLAVGRTAVSQPGAAFMFAKDVEGTLTEGTADAVRRTTEASAFAEKLAGQSGLSNLALLRNVYSNIEQMGKKPPIGQDDPKARELIKELDALVQHLPDTYSFNVYKEPTPNVITTNPAKGTPLPKAGATFNLVLDYHGQLLESISRLEGLIKRTRSTFTVNGNSTTPDIAALTKELEEQKLYLRTFTDDWGKQDVVLKGVDYYIKALKK